MNECNISILFVQKLPWWIRMVWIIRSHLRPGFYNNAESSNVEFLISSRYSLISLRRACWIDWRVHVSPFHMKDNFYCDDFSFKYFFSSKIWFPLNFSNFQQLSRQHIDTIHMAWNIEACCLYFFFRKAKISKVIRYRFHQKFF